MPDNPPLPTGPVGLIARAMALLGGLSLIFAAGVTTVSVVLRWLTSQPVRGDFEMVSLASGVGVFGFLAYGTLVRVHILVDSLTTWLPRRAIGLLDGFWMLVWALVTLWLAERMAVGAAETLRNGMRTMGLLALPYWWAVALGALAFAVTGAVALAWTWRLLRGRF